MAITTQGTYEEVRQRVTSGEMSIEDLRWDGTESTATELLDIGKPYLFRNEVDPTGAVREFYERKMGIVEIVPCQWFYPVVEDDTVTVKPKIVFEEAIRRYQEACGRYSLNTTYNGLRLYLTDDTTSTDDITNAYESNLFQSKIDSLRTNYRHFRNMGSVGQFAQSMDGGVRDRVQKGADKLEEMGADSTIRRIGQTFAETVLMGQKLSFPKIWRDSNYNPNLNITVKLFSPYGHPEAIRDFIIEPLAHLILMCSPRTSDGLSFGYPPTLHVRGYGMVHLAAAYTSSISWRRGGNNSSFSLFRQPLVIDVTLNFQSLIGGFGYYTETENMPADETHLNETTQSFDDQVRGNIDVSFATLGHILDSLRPFDYHG